MKLLVDMNLSPRWIAFPLDAGYETGYWSTLGKADATDSEIMAFAAADDYVALTNDLDFAGILASTHHKKPSGFRSALKTLTLTSKRESIAALQSAQKDLDGGALLSKQTGRA